MTMAGGVTSLFSRRKPTLVFLYIRTLAPRPAPFQQREMADFRTLPGLLGALSTALIFQSLRTPWSALPTGQSGASEGRN